MEFFSYIGLSDFLSTNCLNDRYQPQILLDESL